MRLTSYTLSAGAVQDVSAGVDNKSYLPDDLTADIFLHKQHDPPQQSSEDDKKDASTLDQTDDIYCGVASCRPQFLQGCLNMPCFSAVYSVTGLVTSALSSYINSQISTIEKQFNLSSSMSGFLMSCNDIGYLSATLFTSYYTRRLHIPRTLALCTMLYSVSGLLCTLAYFTTRDQIPSHQKFDSIQGTNHTQDFSGTPTFTQMCRNASVTPASKCDLQDGDTGKKLLFEITETWRTAAIAIIAVGMILQGVAKSPRHAFLGTYVDDNGPKTKTSLFLGIMTGLSIFGPAMAFLLGGVFSNMYVTLEDTNLSPRDPRWIGAWWLGFLIFGAAGFLVGLPLVCFPKRMRSKVKTDKVPPQKMDKVPPQKMDKVPPQKMDKVPPQKMDKVPPQKTDKVPPQKMDKVPPQKTDKVPPQKTDKVPPEKSGEKNNTLTKLKHDLKGFLRSGLRLATNPVFMCLIFANGFNMLAVSGAVSFNAKYLETQFSISASKANMFIGAVKLVGAPLGTVAGGYVTYRLKLSPPTCLKLMIVSKLIALTMTSLGLVVGCPQPPVLKLNILEDEESSGEILSISPSTGATPGCVAGCHCDALNYFPVCGSDGFSYFSPCHAGCSTYNHKEQTFLNCTCMSSNNTAQNAVGGLCEQKCATLYPYLALLLVGTFFSTFVIMPGFIAIVRCVKEEEKPLAIGLNAFIGTLLGWLPGPVVFGALVDSICVLWKRTCSGDGACSLYDIEDFRFRYHAFSSGLRLLTTSLCTGALLFAVCSSKFVFQPHKDDQSLTMTIDPVTDKKKDATQEHKI